MWSFLFSALPPVPMQKHSASVVLVGGSSPPQKLQLSASLFGSGSSTEEDCLSSHGNGSWCLSCCRLFCASPPLGGSQRIRKCPFLCLWPYPQLPQCCHDDRNPPGCLSDLFTMSASCWRWVKVVSVCCTFAVSEAYISGILVGELQMTEPPCSLPCLISQFTTH